MMLTELFPHPAAAVAARSMSQEHSDLLLPNLARRDTNIPDLPPLDETLLAIQIGGIVGAYVIFIALTLTLLLFVGRRLRRAVQASNCTLQVEMMKPKTTTHRDPASPTQNGFRSWISLTKSPHHRTSNNGSVATIDEAVVASDRRRAQEEMEMLYAAVMEHDEQQQGTSPIDEKEVRSPVSIQSAYSNPFSDHAAARMPDIIQPTRVDTVSPAQPPPTSPRSSSRLSKISNLSLFQSSNSKLRSPRFPGQRPAISSPMASPGAASQVSDDQTPLSPRIYNPPPPPPVPSSRNMGTTRSQPPAPLNLSSAGNSTSSLPFRDAYPLRSAPPTKTTILERPENHMAGPRTGLPTPYSPYIPNTPLTPLTPSRLISKKQRKREEKENRLRAVNEEDAVRDNDEMWGF